MARNSPISPARTAARPPAWALVLLGLLSSASVAGEPPTGVLGPFYWTNPSNGRVQSKASSSSPGLTGPLEWTNPAPNATTRSAQDARGSNRGLLGPFVWRNEPAHRHSQPTQATPRNANGQQVDLLGPLHWRNPSMTGGQEPTPDQPQVARSDSPFTLAQGELPASPSDLPPEEVIPIPSSVPESVETPTPQLAPQVAGDADSLSEAESLGEEPVDTRLQFLRTDTVLLEPGEMQFDLGLAYQLFENDFTVVDASSNLVEARIRQRQLVVPLEIRYGLTSRVQFFLGAPVGWANAEFATDVFSSDDNVGGLGDISTGLSILLFDGQGRCTDTVLTVAATLPTGNDPFSPTALGQAQPALGNGFWAISTDLLWIDTYDPVVVFYGIGWRHQFESEFYGYTVRPGDEFRLQLGVGLAVNQNITLSTRFNASFFTRTHLDGASVEGSLREPMSIRFAATVADCGRLIEPFAEIGASDDAASSTFGVTWTY